MKVLVLIVSVLVISEAYNNGYSNFNGYDSGLPNVHSAPRFAANSYIQGNAYSQQYSVNNGYFGGKSSNTQNYYPGPDHYERQQPYTSYHSEHGGNQYIPILDKHGVPVETPEVQLAKQQHLQAHQHAKLRELGENVEQTQYNYPRYQSSSSHFYPSLTPSGVPEDTDAVKIAKAQHFAAHAAERAKHTQWEQESYNNRNSQYWQ